MTAAVEIVEENVPVAGGELAVFGLGPIGSGLARAEEDVIAIHGITSSSRSWLAVARALDGRARLHAVDLRGRGDSRSLPAPYGMATHVDDLLAVLDALGLERAVLAGHSLGAYVVARFAVEHPERISSLVLVDGGLAIPSAEGVDPQAFADAFLGPALARLRMRFASHDEYRRWWRQHPALAPALADGTMEDDDLAAYADHDLTGEPPALRPSVIEEAVRADVLGLVDTIYAHQLAVDARLLTAPRGLRDEPNPMQPLPAARVWAAEDPARRSAELVDRVNHYTITLGRTGAAVVAGAIAAAVSA